MKKRRIGPALRVAAALAVELAIAAAALPIAATLSRADSNAPAMSAGASTRASAAATPSPASSAAGPEARAGPNLLSNGDFATGSGKSPDHWRTGGWNESPAVTAYDWLHSPGSEPELAVSNIQPNDARWLQTMTLDAGWYYVGAEVRTDGVPANAAGASVGLDEDSVNSPALHGTTEWHPLGLYIRIGAHGADIDVALRLGGFGSLNTGRAFFRNARVVKLHALPANAGPAFDLSAVRRASVAPPIGRPWTLIAVFVLLAVVAAAGWRIYGGDNLPPVPVGSQPPPSMPRSERRRRESAAARRRR
ncbi:MAG TPA: hypothetical protein VMI09_14520 [Candidatus Binataceae bacterium]|nr:hypothetical protein [Candidatus Binataceae bacterium]